MERTGIVRDQTRKLLTQLLVVLLESRTYATEHVKGLDRLSKRAQQLAVGTAVTASLHRQINLKLLTRQTCLDNKEVPTQQNATGRVPERGVRGNK